MLDKFALEYSRLQDCFNIDKLGRCIGNNCKTMETDNIIDYKIIGIFNSYDGASEAAKKIRNKIGERGPLNDDIEVLM